MVAGTDLHCLAREGPEMGSRIFIFSAEMLHSALSRSISDHSANLCSPGRANSRGASRAADLVQGGAEHAPMSFRS